jgi:hypothetical protein
MILDDPTLHSASAGVHQSDVITVSPGGATDLEGKRNGSVEACIWCGRPRCRTRGASARCGAVSGKTNFAAMSSCSRLPRTRIIGSMTRATAFVVDRICSSPCSFHQISFQEGNAGEIKAVDESLPRQITVGIGCGKERSLPYLLLQLLASNPAELICDKPGSECIRRRAGVNGVCKSLLAPECCCGLWLEQHPLSRQTDLVAI